MQNTARVFTNSNEGKPNDPVRRSTFTIIDVDGSNVAYDTYRTPTPQDNRPYTLFESAVLTSEHHPKKGR
jgi:hypothetical protein